jgi:hypothetical protein
VVSVLAAAAVFVAAYSGGDVGRATLQAAGALPAHDLVNVTHELDAMGDSGSAGMDAAKAAAITAESQAELTGDITFSVPSGTFQGQVSVRLSTAVADAQIRYTTNGAVPTGSSSLYSAALTFTATTRLRAQAFVGGTATGAMGTALYVARAVNATHDLPLVVLDDFGGGKPNKTATKDVSFMVMAPQSGSTSLAAVPAIATRAAFRLRGQSSASFAKAPYKIELRDNADEDADYPVLGMPADSDWALLGPFPDKALIRDAFAWDLARDMGLRAPRYAFVELYLNLDANPMAAADYQGVYLFAETIKRSSDRVDIAKLKKTDVAEPDVTGGYIMQFNLMATDGPTLTCTRKSTQDPCWSDLELTYPKEDDLQSAQKTWITSYIQKFHDALHSSNPSNPQTGYPAYIDVDSFVNRIIHNELAREGDSYMRSTHFYKDKGGKLVAGPVWDYDLAYDAVPMSGGWGTPATSAVQGWQYQPMTGGFGMSGPSDWFVKLMADPTFLSAVKARWNTLRAGPLSDARMTARITALSTPLAAAAKRNFQKWPNLNTAMVGMFQTQVTQTWEQQVTKMRDFLTQRAAWLNSTSGWGGGSVTPPTSQPPTTNPPTTNPPGVGACSASYAVTNQWASGFQGEVKVTAGTSAITGWRVTWTYAGGQQLTQAWNGKLTTSGSTVTVANESYNGALGAGASTTFGFTGTYSGTNNAPSVTCTTS